MHTLRVHFFGGVQGGGELASQVLPEFCFAKLHPCVYGSAVWKQPPAFLFEPGGEPVLFHAVPLYCEPE
jgi:hypothetical protein